MGRPVVLSNGQLFVGINENGLVHDFYYPYVGLDNLANARHLPHKIGVWVDGKFAWTDDGTWKITILSEEDALISNIAVVNEKLKITLHFKDGIDHERNALLRQITVTNQANAERSIRLFMHQAFEISRAGRGDTALYVPEEHYILDYKGRYCLLIAGKFADGGDFDQYAVGLCSQGDTTVGTFMDAEDGELSNNPVEHGGVDSVIRFTNTYKPNESKEIDYWVIAGSNQLDIQTIHDQFKKNDIALHMEGIRRGWQKWLSSGAALPESHKKHVKNSLLTIKAHCDDRGSILASGDSSIFNYGRDYYCYCWPRDASYALWPLIRLGYYQEARNFFEFARDTIHRDGYLMHKYQPDRAVGSTWHPLVHGNSKELAIQEDETASVLFMMGEYFEATQDVAFLTSFYPSFIHPAANFMTNYIDLKTGLPHASYDLWEEKFLTSTYTASTVIAALNTASKLAQVLDYPDDAAKWAAAAKGILDNFDKLLTPDGYFAKGFYLQPDGKLSYDNVIDISSLYGPLMFAGLSLKDPRLAKTVAMVEKKLLNTSPAGGVIRYENDQYFLSKKKFKGNPWIVCTLWLAQYYCLSHQTDKAKALTDWAIQRAEPSGALSEQFDPETATPLSVSPLVWSHAELVNTILDLSGNKPI